MSRLKQKWMVPTYLKYMFSYLLILCVFMAGTWFIIRKQMTDRYFDQQVDSAKAQLDYLAERIKDDLVFMLKIDSNILTSEAMQKYNYQEKNTHTEAIKMLQMYDSANLMINNIAYMSRKKEDVLSTNYVVRWKDDCFLIDYGVSQVVLDPSQYLDKEGPQLIRLSDEGREYLIYFPFLSSKQNYIYFYTLNINEIQSKMKIIVSGEIRAVALVDNGGELVKGENAALLTPYLETDILESGKYEQKDGNYLCVSQEILSGYRLVSLVDNSSLMHQISTAFTSSYQVFMLLGVAGFLLIFVGMNITYIPLRRLTQRVSMESFVGKYHLKKLEDTFFEVSRENLELKGKLDNYRSSIQKALLDSLITAESGARVKEASIDQFFDENLKKNIFIICLYSPEGTLPVENFRAALRTVIPNEENCVMLESGKERAVFLLNYVGEEPDKAGQLKYFLQRWFEETGCLSAVSMASDTPMDIPALYENARQAGCSWPEIPVADGSLLSEEDEQFAYPHEKLNDLTESLKENQFGKARAITEELFLRVVEMHFRESNLKEYYVQNVILGVLLSIANAMNRSNIAFEEYSDIYYETLFFCRSFAYEEKADEIILNVRRLLNLYEKINTQKLVNSVPFKKTMEEGYCQPEFSIAKLAEQFGVSVSYMSYQFKKEMGMNFLDYLWERRLCKAKELLSRTDMSVDEIALAVGYYSRTSFMKRFKQDTGLTPTQYRMEEE